MFSSTNVRLSINNFNVFRYNVTLSISMGYGKWSKVELPLMPKVAFVHKILKSALEECESEIPDSYTRRIRNNLTEIRKVNWNVYNSKEIGLYEAQKVKKLLEDLKEREHDLPEPLAKKLENVCLFGSLQDAIDCLNDRSGLDTHDS
jgi:hypothetical protein